MTAPTTDAPAKRGRGRPPKITDEAERAILAAIRNHQQVHVAYAIAGVAKQTFYGWLDVAAEAREMLNRGATPGSLGVHRRRCLEFSDSLTRAMAQAEGHAVQQNMKAGYEPNVERRTHTRCVGLDEQRQPIMVTEETTIERPPDVQPLQWWLERRVPGYRSRQELTGTDGGPIEVAHRLATLRETITTWQQEQGALNAGD